MRVLICGDREWTNQSLIDAAVAGLPDGAVVVHGDCRGADKMADKAAETMGYERDPYPADWTRYRNGTGPIRNQQMLDSGIDLVIAFHNNIENSKGTADMIARAIAVGIPVEMYHDREAT